MIKWVTILLLLGVISVGQVSNAVVPYGPKPPCLNLSVPEAVYVNNNENGELPIDVENCSDQRQYLTLNIIDPGRLLESGGVKIVGYSPNIVLEPYSSDRVVPTFYVPESTPRGNYKISIVTEARSEDGGAVLSRYYDGTILVVGNNSLQTGSHGLSGTVVENAIEVPSNLSTTSTDKGNLANAYFIILVLVAAFGLTYYALVLRKKSVIALRESPKQDYPRFFFERRLSRGFTIRSIIFYMAVIFFCSVFLPDFVVFQSAILPYSYDVYTLMESHLGVFVVIISTILLGVLYRNKFFEILNIFKLGDYTLASVKRSFLGRKPFFICLAILEIPLLLYYIPYLGNGSYGFPGFELGIISIFVFFIPLAAQIYAAFWSGLLSIRSIIRESVPSSHYLEIINKIRKMTSLWKWPFMIWITSTTVGLLLAPSDTFFGYITWLYIFTGIIFTISDIAVQRELSRFKKLSLNEIEKTNQQSYWKVQINLSSTSELSEEELDRALKSYETGLNKVKKQVQKMPTWLFSGGMVFGLAVYAAVLWIINAYIVFGSGGT